MLHIIPSISPLHNVISINISIRFCSPNEELLKEVEHQLTKGSDGLNKEDWFLLQYNFNELATATGRHQEHWLLAIQAAREASHIIRTEQADMISNTTLIWDRDRHSNNSVPISVRHMLRDTPVT